MKNRLLRIVKVLLEDNNILLGPFILKNGIIIKEIELFDDKLLFELEHIKINNMCIQVEINILSNDMIEELIKLLEELI